MARLKINAPDGGREVVLGDRLAIGRVEGVDLVLDDKGISRRHCEIARTADGHSVKDLGSSNGTFVNGEKVTERTLADGDQLRVGGVTLTYCAADADFALRFSTGEHRGREVALTSQRTTLGRRPDNVIPFVDVKVSGVHVEIVKEGDSHVLRDLGSTNGTLLDGNKVTEVALSHGDRVKLGDNEFTFVDLRRGAREPEAGGEPAGAARAAPPLPARSKAAAILGLAGVTLAVAAAAAWQFLFAKGEVAPTSGRAAPAAPAGTLLAEDWSFEDASGASALWTAEIGEGFAVRRGRAASGSFAFAAQVSGGHATASRRQPVEIPAARVLRFGGSLEADPGVLVSAGLRFLRAAGDEASPRSLTLPAARSLGGDFAPFAVEIVPPAWAKRVEVVVAARGEGSAAADDLALQMGAVPAAAPRTGELALLPRGPGAFFVDHRAPLCELFLPFGSGTIAPVEEGAAPSRAELPPLAFEASVAMDGTRLALRPGRGAFAAEGFAALCAPEIVANGVTLVTRRGAEQRFGAFDAADVTRLLLGSAAERFELALARPVRVTAVTHGDALELRLHAAGDLDVSYRSGFESERKEASELLARAQEDWRAGRAGAAIARLKEIHDRLPHDEKTVALARQLYAEIAPRLQDELTAIEADAAAAEFLGSLERSRRTLARAKALLAQVEGVEAMKELAARTERLETAVAAMEREQREREARRLLALARAYAAQKPPAPDRRGTAAELMAELQATYADTAAARDARGEPPPAGGEQAPQGGG